MSKRQLEKIDFVFKTKPFAHQKEAFELSRLKKNFALLMEQGTGKTKVIIDTAAYLWDQGKIDGLLIAAPNGVHRNWTNLEIPDHMPDRIPIRSITWKASKASTKAFKSAWAQLIAFNGLAVFSINIEALSSPTGVRMCEEFLRNRNAIFTIDESSRIKNPQAKRTKAAFKLSQLASGRRILTGTPVTKGPFDLWAQFKFLSPDIIGVSNYTAFKAYYAIIEPKTLSASAANKLAKARAIRNDPELHPRRAGLVAGRDYYEQLIDYTNLDELRKIIEPFSYRKTKDECLDLPAKIYQRLPVELTSLQAQLYSSMAKLFVAELPTGEILAAPIVLTKLLRLRQIVGGYIPGDDPEKGKAIEGGNPKLEALSGLLDDFDGRAIIWAQFKPELAAIAARLRETYGPESVVEYHGSIGDDLREYAKIEFQNPLSPVRFFVGNPATGGLGLTLTAATLVIYYSNDYDLEKRLQSEDRAHRIGQKQSVVYVDIEAVDTIDEDIVTAVQKKLNLADYMTGDALRKMLDGDLFGMRKE